MRIIWLTLLVIGCSVFLSRNSSSIAQQLIEYPDLGRAFSASQRDVFRGLQERLKSAPIEDQEVRAELKSQINSLPPLFLYHLAERTFPLDVEEAMQWYWLGHIRARLDAVLCSDTTAAQGITYLPGFARSVTAYIRENPEAAGRIGLQVLERSDLYSSQASPWWICVHGIKATSNSLQRELKNRMSEQEREKLGLPKFELPKPLAWLKQENEVKETYAKLIAGAKNSFEKLTEPMDETLEKLALTVQPTKILGDETFNSLSWTRKDGVALEVQVSKKPNKILLWTDTGVSTVANDVGFGGICVSGDRVSYRVRPPKSEDPNPSSDSPKPKFDRNAPRTLYFKEGRIGRTLAMQSFEYRRSVSPGVFQKASAKPQGFSRWTQSSLTCRWQRVGDRGATQVNGAFITDLGLGRGFLESVGDGTYYYLSVNDQAVKVSDQTYPVKCMQYHKFIDAFQMVACPVSFANRRNQPENLDLQNVALFSFKNGKPTIEVEPLEPIPGERGPGQTLITKRGVMRLMASRQTPVGAKPGGIYWYTAGKWKKIWEGYPTLADVNSDGCKIAFSGLGDQGSLYKSNAYVWNVCDALPE